MDNFAMVRNFRQLLSAVNNEEPVIYAHDYAYDWLHDVYFYRIRPLEHDDEIMLYHMIRENYSSVELDGDDCFVKLEL